MRVLLLGASGFIGSACAVRLLEDGHAVRALGRRRTRLRDNGVERIEADLGTLMTPERWREILTGCDAVINCAGVFSDRAGDSTRTVHVDAPAALYRACELAGVRRVVLLSAVGVEAEITAFSRSKKEGEDLLKCTKLEWIILRPSIVLGEAAYGGGALIRGLAALPMLPLEKEQGLVQPVQLSDVVDTVMWAINANAQVRVTVELVGPDRVPVNEIAASYRRWMGWKPAAVVSVGAPLMAVVYAAGEVFNRLGWRSPISLTGRRELRRGGEGDPQLWRRLTGVRPQSVAAALAARPSTAQEKLFAAFYFLYPLSFIVTSVFWIGTGIVSIGPGYDIGVDYMERAGAGALAGPSVIAGGLADLAIGIGIAFRRTARLALWAAIGISFFYFVTGTILLPELWLDPIGPMLKIWPLIVFNIVCLAMLRDR